MGKLILIAEGQPSVARYLAKILELAGYCVMIEHKGIQVLDVIRQCRPDLILCNTRLPELDGFSIKQLLAATPDLGSIPFIFIPERYERYSFRKAMDTGADDFLSRPFTGDELLRTVQVRLKKKDDDESPGQHKEMRATEKKIRTVQDIQSLFLHQVTRRVKKREIVYREDDMPHYLFFLKSGKIKSFKTNEWGKDYIIDIYTDHSFFGFEYIINNRKYLESTMAMEDSELPMVPRDEFNNLLCTHSELLLAFMNYTAEHLSLAEERLIRLAYDSARKRVAEALLFVHRKYQTSGKTSCAFSIQREDISAISGITVESVSRNITSFKEEGLIETDNGMIRLINIDKLQKLRN